MNVSFFQKKSFHRIHENNEQIALNSEEARIFVEARDPLTSEYEFKARFLLQ